MGYWCKSLENANQCNALAHCKSQGITFDSTKNKIAFLRRGANKCTWGPSYWCKSLENANECNALAHCKSQGITFDSTKDKLRLLRGGADRCTWGPSYWLPVLKTPSNVTRALIANLGASRLIETITLSSFATCFDWISQLCLYNCCISIS